MAMIGDKTSLPDENHFATKSEITGRDKVASQPRPTTFRQIGPEDGGGSLGNMKAVDRSSTFKFSGGV